MNSPGWMIVNCPVSCNACHLRDPNVNKLLLDKYIILLIRFDVHLRISICLINQPLHLDRSMNSLRIF